MTAMESNRNFYTNADLLRTFMCCTLVLVSGCHGTKKPQQQVSIDLSVLAQPHQIVTFNEVRKVDAIPETVLVQFQGGLADPGQDFQSTDVIRGRPLPLRRLIIAGASQRYYILHYERGGIGRSWLLALFELSDGKANVRWVSNTGPMTDLREVKTALESSKNTNELGRTGW